jgi:hypothetical protein
MKTKLALPLLSRATLLALLITLHSPLQTWAQGTAFTYQGRLNSGGSPANGSYDLRFRLAADALGNDYVGATILTNGVFISNGLFTYRSSAVSR